MNTQDGPTTALAAAVAPSSGTDFGQPEPTGPHSTTAGSVSGWSAKTPQNPVGEDTSPTATGDADPVPTQGEVPATPSAEPHRDAENGDTRPDASETPSPLPKAAPATVEPEAHPQIDTERRRRGRVPMLAAVAVVIVSTSSVVVLQPWSSDTPSAQGGRPAATAPPTPGATATTPGSTGPTTTPATPTAPSTTGTGATPAPVPAIEQPGSRQATPGATGTGASGGGQAPVPGLPSAGAPSSSGNGGASAGGAGGAAGGAAASGGTNGGQQPGGANPPPTAAPGGQSAPAPLSVRFSAVHGPGCDAEWFYADPIFKASNGGLAADGCHGNALAAQVSPEAGHADGGAFWQFNTGRSGPGNCTIDVYIPNTTQAAGLAHYALDPRQDGYPHLYNPDPIDQATARGQWKSLGTWPIPSDGWFSVTLFNKPARAGDTYSVAASAARATCRW